MDFQIPSFFAHGDFQTEKFGIWTPNHQGANLKVQGILPLFGEGEVSSQGTSSQRIPVPRFVRNGGTLAKNPMIPNDEMVGSKMSQHA